MCVNGLILYSGSGQMALKERSICRWRRALLTMDGHFSGGSTPVPLTLGVQMPGMVERDCSARKVQPQIGAFLGWTSLPLSPVQVACGCHRASPNGSSD